MGSGQEMVLYNVRNGWPSILAGIVAVRFERRVSGTMYKGKLKE